MQGRRRQQQQLPQQVPLLLHPQVHSGQSQQQVSTVSVCMGFLSVTRWCASRFGFAPAGSFNQYKVPPVSAQS